MASKVSGLTPSNRRKSGAHLLNLVAHPPSVPSHPTLLSEVYWIDDVRMKNAAEEFLFLPSAESADYSAVRSGNRHQRRATRS